MMLLVNTYTTLLMLMFLALHITGAASDTGVKGQGTLEEAWREVLRKATDLNSTVDNLLEATPPQPNRNDVLRGLKRFRSDLGVGCVYYNESITALPFWFRTPCLGTLDEFFRLTHVGFAYILGVGTQPVYIVQSPTVGRCWYLSNPELAPYQPYTIGEWASTSNLVPCSDKNASQQFAIFKPPSDPTWRVMVTSTRVCMYANGAGCASCKVQKPGVSTGRFSFATCANSHLYKWADHYWHVEDPQGGVLPPAVPLHSVPVTGESTSSGEASAQSKSSDPLSRRSPAPSPSVPATVPPAASQGNEVPQLSIGAIIGISASCLVGLSALVTIAYNLWKWINKKKLIASRQEIPDKPMASQNAVHY